MSFGEVNNDSSRDSLGFTKRGQVREKFKGLILKRALEYTGGGNVEDSTV